MATATRFVKILKEVISASAAVGSFLTATSTNAMVTMKNKLPQYLYLELNTFIGKKKNRNLGDQSLTVSLPNEKSKLKWATCYKNGQRKRSIKDFFLCFASYWFGGWFEISGPTTEQSRMKAKQSRIDLDTPLYIALCTCGLKFFLQDSNLLRPALNFHPLFKVYKNK